MKFQTYVRTKEGKWMRWGPCPERAAAAQAEVKDAKQYLNKPLFGVTYTHIVAMPYAEWSFA